ncbi:MAG: chemotaxis protein CheW [Chloroflexi bacterium]|nr:chemotaxis protein CheW [Chloroflexota bacterium]MCC6895061.1 chemotaxis protein CheW [Anaerolineae bacterium]
MMNIQDLFSGEELKLLQLRAERVGIPMHEDDKLGRISVLTTAINKERFAIPIDSITSVYDDVLIIPIPGVPGFIAGITNVRGHIISVLNLGSVLGLKTETILHGAMLVTETQNGSIGLCVEAVGEAVELPLNQMNPTPTNLNLDHPEYFQGIFLDGTALLHIHAILADPRLIVDDSAL